MSKFEKKDSQECFNKAIREGRLSSNPEDVLWAGYYMYMGTYDGKDSFKYVDLRFYLP